MTEQEAILRLKEEIEIYTPYAKAWNDARLDIESLDMAIQALEQTQGIKDAIAEIEKVAEEEKTIDKVWATGLRHSIGIIHKHTGIGEQE